MILVHCILCQIGVCFKNTFCTKNESLIYEYITVYISTSMLYYYEFGENIVNY